MKTFIVQVTVNVPYPRTFEYRTVGSNLWTGVSKALKQFKKEVKGKRISRYSITVDVV